MSRLKFDTATHTYTFDGKIVPSVTQVLKAAGFINFDKVPKDILEKSLRFGLAVHSACEIDDTADITMYDIDATVMHCVRQWRDIKKDILSKVYANAPTIQYVEKPLYSAVGFAGTPDRVYAFGSILVISDIKTGIDAPGGEIQTAAYATLAVENYPTPVRKVFRFIVNLTYDAPEGSFKECRNKNDWNVFLSALNCYKYRERNNLL